jgi:hypothetical protein
MKLLIDAFTKDGEHCNRIIAAHIDASKNLTVISRSVVGKFKEDLFITEKLEHHNIFEGLLTLYYSGGNYLEIKKYRPGQID